MSFLHDLRHRCALRMAAHAIRVMPADRRRWAIAMQNEMTFAETDDEAFVWACGCVWACYHERMSSMRNPAEISRTKFVILFLVSALAFLFVTTSLLGSSGVRLFPQNGESFLGTGSQIAWKNAVATILLPIKIVLVGPLLPYIDFLRQDSDTPPPFFLIGFIFYWSLLAMFIHYLLGKLKHP